MKKGVKVLFLSLTVVFAIYFVSMAAFDSYNTVTGKAVVFSFFDLYKITGKAVESGTCSGNVFSCDSYSYELTCNNVRGCLWVGNLCSGSPKQCIEVTSKRDCNHQPGCQWYNAPRVETGQQPSTSFDSQQGTTPTQIPIISPVLNFFSQLFSKEEQEVDINQLINLLQQINDDLTNAQAQTGGMI